MLTPVLLSFGYDRTMLANRSIALRNAGYGVQEEPAGVTHTHALSLTLLMPS
jgi:hypothetical protein